MRYQAEKEKCVERARERTWRERKRERERERQGERKREGVSVKWRWMASANSFLPSFLFFPPQTPSIFLRSQSERGLGDLTDGETETEVQQLPPPIHCDLTRGN